MSIDFSRIGGSTISYRSLPLRDALERLSRHRFKSIDIGIIPRFCPHYDPLTATDDVRRGTADCVAMNGLTVTTLNTRPGVFNLPGADVATIYKAASENFALAWALGCRIVTIQNGVAVPPAKWMESARKVAYHLRELARIAQGIGLSLSVEVPHRGTLASDARQASDLLDLIGEGATCTFDTSHIQAGGQTIRQGLALLGDRIDHVHLRDARREDVYVTPGDGDVPFEHLFAWIEERRYTGGVTLEVLPPEGLSPDEPVRDDILSLTELVIRVAADRGNVIVVGRGSQVILADRRDTLHVRVIAPINVRCQRIAERYDVDLEEAMTLIHRKDQDKVRYLRQYYDVDWEESNLYHLIINTERTGVELAARLIAGGVTFINTKRK